MAATEHRCVAGGWAPGPVSACEKCKSGRKFQVGQFVQVKTGKL